jgi:DNA-binding response OmpR family regulator
MVAVRHSGHDVTGVRNGQEALAAFRAEPIDLVVLDVLMPGMSGVEGLAQLRQNKSLHQPLVLLLSTLSPRAKLFEGRREQVEGFLNKPFSIFDLRNRVNDLLRPKEAT